MMPCTPPDSVVLQLMVPIEMILDLFVDGRVVGSARPAV
jgi:hypothetical protein